MPGIVREPKVNFASMETVRRPAREDEQLVMQTFVKHARHCHDCANPLKTYKDGSYLCDRGLAYAQDIAEYLYIKAGVMFSKYDQTRDHMPMQVETPAGSEVVRDLLRVLDASLRKRRPAPIISHDKTYYVPDRRSYPPDNLYDHEVIEIEPRKQHEIKRHKSEKKKKTAYVPGRGSLYRQDEKDRRQRQEEEPVIVYAAPARSRYKEHR